MQRETKTIVTPVGGIKIEILTYLTGREKRSLTNVYLEEKLNYDSENKRVEGISPAAINRAQDIAWKTVIQSFDGKKDGENFSVVDAVLDLRAEDYDFVVNAVNDITSDKDFEQKKTS